MTTAAELIDTLTAKAKRLTEARQREIAAALAEMLDEPYELSPEEMAVLRPALEEALAGQHVIDAEQDERPPAIADRQISSLLGS